MATKKDGVDPFRFIDPETERTQARRFVTTIKAHVRVAEAPLELLEAVMERIEHLPRKRTGIAVPRRSRLAIGWQQVCRPLATPVIVGVLLSIILIGWLAYRSQEPYRQAAHYETQGEEAEAYGTWRQALKPYDRALKLYQQLQDKQGQARVQRRQAALYYRLQDYDQSVRAASDALATNPDDQQTAIYLGAARYCHAFGCVNERS